MLFTYRQKIRELLPKFTGCFKKLIILKSFLILHLLPKRFDLNLLQKPQRTKVQAKAEAKAKEKNP